jgi:hypothetical protein
VARRLHTRDGEIDLLVAREGRLACVEVKAQWVAAGLAPGPWRPGARLGPRRLRRLARAAARLGARVDLVEVFWCAREGRARIVHHVGLPAPLSSHGLGTSHGLGWPGRVRFESRGPLGTGPPPGKIGGS